MGGNYLNGAFILKEKFSWIIPNLSGSRAYSWFKQKLSNFFKQTICSLP